MSESYDEYMHMKAEHDYQRRQKELEDLEALMDCRAGRLLRAGVPFFVVRADEPYARWVVAMIREHEGEKWTEKDEAWARKVLQDGFIHRMSMTQAASSPPEPRT